MQKYFEERGRNYDEIMERLRRKYGENFRIQGRRDVPASGIPGLFGRMDVEFFGYIITKAEARQAQRNKDLENRAEILSLVGANVPAVNVENDGGRVDPEPPEMMTRVLEEIQSLKGQLAVGASAMPPKPYAVLTELSDILKENEFEPSWIDSIMNRLRCSLTADQLDNRQVVHDSVAGHIIESISFMPPEKKQRSRITILVGPTGVGKTTTIAKLAAQSFLTGAVSNVRIITVDSYRIGAREQMIQYGDIMEIPVIAVNEPQQLEQEIESSSDSDLILIDTFGSSPHDKNKIDEMMKLLSVCGTDASIQLVLSATTTTSNLRELLSHFRFYGYDSIIITKLDETSRIGSLISGLTGISAELSYFTDGQGVPLDIAAAQPSRLLGYVKGLDYSPDILEALNTSVNHSERGVNYA